MDDKYYSPETINNFIRYKLCLNKKELLETFENQNITKFRKLLSKFSDRKKVQSVVYALVTDSIRPIILDIVSELTTFLRPMGDLVVTGGEAFNMYFPREHRVVTSDIDTKFVPTFENNFFEKLQITKILLWERLRKISKKYEKTIVKRVNKVSKVGKMLGVTAGPDVKIRYNLKRKSIKDKVLIDVELMALDLTIKYYDPETSKRSTTNLGGILDIVFMRPNEMGSEVQHDTRHFGRNIAYAGKRFLLDDLFVMQKLGLRPGKRDKDTKRMMNFAKYVLKLQDIPDDIELNELYKKCSKVVKPEKKVFKKRKVYSLAKLRSMASKVDPLASPRRITAPLSSKVVVLSTGITGPRGQKINKYEETAGPMRYNMAHLKWVKNNRRNYIKNEKNYRLKVVNERMPLRSNLYGYNPERNKNIPKNIINKATKIQYAGTALKFN